MRIELQAAFVLHHRDYSETSLTLEAFTPEFGRIGLLAKGARRASSPWRGLLKPFQPLLLSWTGRGELPILIHAETNGENLATQGAPLYCGFYVNELLLRLLHRHDPHEALFTAYGQCLAALRRDAPAEIALRLFEKRLLAEIGYGLVLDRDIGDNSPLEPEALYDYCPDQGPVRLGQAGRREEAEGVVVHGRSLLALAAETLEDDPLVQREIKRLMRNALDIHLAGRPLHTRRLFGHIMRTHTPNPDRGTAS